MGRCHLSPAVGPNRMPRGWLLTDPRLARHGVVAARQLPPGSPIIVRSDGLPRAARHRLVRHLRRIARARCCPLFIAGVAPDQARRLGADGVHLRTRSAQRAAQARRLGLMTSAPVHSAREARAAARADIGYALISPLYPTRSHAGAATLSVREFFRLARLVSAQPVALGGMTAARHRHLLRRCAGSAITPGWAAIDAWERGTKAPTDQKRNCVPT